MITFLVRDTDHVAYDSVKSNHVAGQFPVKAVTRKGKMFAVGGGAELELFMLSVLAQAMDRSVKTLLAWEKRGLLPKPMYELTDHRIRRWYSKEQVTNLHRVMWVKYSCRKNHTMDLEALAEDIRRVFWEQRIVMPEPEIPAARRR